MTLIFWCYSGNVLGRQVLHEQNRFGQVEVGGYTRRTQTAWLCLASVLERPWLALDGLFLSSYA